MIRFSPLCFHLLCSLPKVTDLNATDLVFFGLRIPFCAADALWEGVILMGPYCAIPRDYLSDNPPYNIYCALWGFWCLNMANWVREHAKWTCDTPPPPKRGTSAILARYPMKTRQMGAIPPSAILSRKGIARYGGGGVSRIGPLRAPCKLLVSFLSTWAVFLGLTEGFSSGGFTSNF